MLQNEQKYYFSLSIRFDPMDLRGGSSLYLNKFAGKEMELIVEFCVPFVRKS